MPSELIVTKNNHIICEECGNADSGGGLFLASEKNDDRLSKDNLKFYRVKWIYGGKSEFRFPKIDLTVGDVVMTEALGIDIEFNGRKYKVFDVDHIVAKVNGEIEND